MAAAGLFYRPDQDSELPVVEPFDHGNNYDGEFQDLTKIWLNFQRHIIDVWHEPRVYVACEGLSDLGIGPNQPTATIIAEYSASYHHGALTFTLVRAREFQDVSKIWLHFWRHIIDVWHLPIQCICSL